MSAIHWQQLRHQGRQHNAVGVLSDAGSHILSTLHEWRRRMRERAELGALDDRTLKDIGLTRADAEFLANKPFWRE